MWYKIEPLDTLFFRDGRPFSMGAETWANPVFPPYPSTLYGAIRTWLIFEKGNLEDFKNGKFKEEIGTTTEKGKLKIKGPFVALENNLFFPVPNDMLSNNARNARLVSVGLLKKPNCLISDYCLEKMLINKTDLLLDNVDGFIDIFSLKDYLAAKEVDLSFVEKNEIFFSEKKTGIKRNRKTLSSEEECLYRVPMIRLKKEANFFVEIDGLNSYPKEGIIQFGGEGKIVKIEQFNNDPLATLRNLNFEFKDKIFKLYLATPCIFKNGWYPSWIKPENFEGEYNGVKLRLVGCAIGKFNLIGGWDLAGKKPKVMYKAVPAGSVYYFKILADTSIEKVKETFHLQNISDINSEEGFGLSLVGEVKL